LQSKRGLREISPTNLRGKPLNHSGGPIIRTAGNEETAAFHFTGEPLPTNNENQRFRWDESREDTNRGVGRGDNILCRSSDSHISDLLRNRAWGSRSIIGDETKLGVSRRFLQ
jgi:hypothetical protein